MKTGSRYVGSFKAGAMHGKGQLYSASGQKTFDIENNMGTVIKEFRDEARLCNEESLLRQIEKRKL